MERKSALIAVTAVFAVTVGVVQSAWADEGFGPSSRQRDRSSGGKLYDNVGISTTASSAAQAPASTMPVPTGSLPEGGCYRNDRRLDHLGKVIAGVKSGDPPKEPIRIKSEYLIQMNTKIVDMLGSSYIVVEPGCSTTAVVSGMLLHPVSVDFDVLLNELVTALGQDNKKRASYLVNNFKAAPIDPVQGLALAMIAPYPGSMQEKLSTFLYIPLRDRAGFDEWALTMADLFARLGGDLTATLVLHPQGGAKYSYKIDKDTTEVIVLLPKLEGDNARNPALQHMGYYIR